MALSSFFATLSLGRPFLLPRARPLVASRARSDRSLSTPTEGLPEPQAQETPQPRPIAHDPPLILIMTPATSSNTTTSTSTRTPQPSPASSSSSSAAAAQSATQACAVCKYQRRKCNPDCTLAPYFPADQQRQFLNAHRLFGVSNILKIIRHLDPVQRAEAMRSIIFQSNARAHDPVGGCCRIILELERQIERESAELALVLRQLTIYRAQAQAALSPATTDLSVNPNLDDAGGNNTIYSGHENSLLLPMQQQQPQQRCYDYLYYDGGGGDNPNNSDSNNNSINNSHSMMEVPTSLQQRSVDEEDVKSLVEIFDVRQTLTIEDKEKESEPFQCSGKIELKEELIPRENVPEHDLKGDVWLPGRIFGLEGGNRSVGKWRKHVSKGSSLKMQATKSNGDLQLVH